MPSLGDLIKSNSLQNHLYADTSQIVFLLSLSLWTLESYALCIPNISALVPNRHLKYHMYGTTLIAAAYPPTPTSHPPFSIVPPSQLMVLFSMQLAGPKSICHTQFLSYTHKQSIKSWQLYLQNRFLSSLDYLKLLFSLTIST